MLRRGGIWTVRVHVPVDLRPLIERRELWRSVGTAYPMHCHTTASATSLSALLPCFLTLRMKIGRCSHAAQCRKSIQRSD